MLLSEMSGVERDTEFRVKGYEAKFKIFCGCTSDGKDIERLFCEGYNGWQCLENSETLYKIIRGLPDNIIHLPPPLTDEQREQLKSVYALGGRWLVKDMYKDIRYFPERPHKSKFSWQTGNDGVDAYYGFRLYNSLDIYSLVSWADPEPYDIGKALGVGE